MDWICVCCIKLWFHILWENNLFYSYAITNTVVRREKKRKQNKKKERKKRILLNFKSVSMGFFAASLNSAYCLQLISEMRLRQGFLCLPAFFFLKKKDTCLQPKLHVITLQSLFPSKLYLLSLWFL